MTPVDDTDLPAVPKEDTVPQSTDTEEPSTKSALEEIESLTKALDEKISSPKSDEETVPETASEPIVSDHAEPDSSDLSEASFDDSVQDPSQPESPVETVPEIEPKAAASVAVIEEPVTRIRTYEDVTTAKQKAEKKTPPPKKKSAPAKKSTKKKKKKKKSRFNGTIFGGIIIVAIILTVSLLLAVTGIRIGMEFYGIGKSESDIRFNIPEGSNNDRIADILVENGVIENKTLFKIALKLQHDPTLYPGDITLQPSNGYTDIIEKLSVQRESYKSVTVTFTEGENLLTIASKLEEAGVCPAEDFIFQFNRDQGFVFEKQIDAAADTFYSREGFFYPDTYEFYVDDSAENVSRKVKEAFEKQYTTIIEPKLASTKLSFTEVMTLASIVQLESASVEEMPNVASVFINRLNDPDTYPMLQSDTTKNYIKNVITTQADTEASLTHYTESYDTYTCKGLPAGPICNPGIDAIKAVIDPAKTKYYYFCNNLTTKQTFYAETLEEHEANLKKAGLA
ncbi:MAG: endolytic transglycosylase MltG [Ruminococcus sp.]|nr:endolytic transglycosylase MltG [Ruminococcus sp.]